MTLAKTLIIDEKVKEEKELCSRSRLISAVESCKALEYLLILPNLYSKNFAVIFNDVSQGDNPHNYISKEGSTVEVRKITLILL